MSQQGGSKIGSFLTIFRNLFKEKLCFQSTEFFLEGYFFVKWKTLSMCLELNICHNELTDDVYGQVYL